MQKICLSACAALAFSGSAFAADMAVKAPPLPPVVAPAYSWTGFYIGGNAGYGWSDGDVDPNGSVISFADPAIITGGPNTASASAAAASTTIRTDANGFIGGAQIGFNYQINNKWVVGIETDFAGANISGSKTVSSVATSPLGSGLITPFNVASFNSGEQRLDSLGTVRARLGYAQFDRLLIYSTGGLAYGHATSATSISQNCVPISAGSCGTGVGIQFSPTAGSASGTLVGWTLGGGLEWAFAPNWSTKLEYLYYDLGRLSYSLNPIISTVPTATGPFATVGVNPTAEFKGNIVRVGANYKFQ